MRRMIALAASHAKPLSSRFVTQAVVSLVVMIAFQPLSPEGPPVQNPDGFWPVAEAPAIAERGPRVLAERQPPWQQETPVLRGLLADQSRRLVAAADARRRHEDAAATAEAGVELADSCLPACESRDPLLVKAVTGPRDIPAAIPALLPPRRPIHTERRHRARLGSQMLAMVSAGGSRLADDTSEVAAMAADGVRDAAIDLVSLVR